MSTSPDLPLFSDKYLDKDLESNSLELHNVEREGLLASDLERDGHVVQNQASPTTTALDSYEHTVSTRRKLLALLGYFICNIGLTLYNKTVFGFVSLSALTLPCQTTASFSKTGKKVFWWREASILPGSMQTPSPSRRTEIS